MLVLNVRVLACVRACVCQHLYFWNMYCQTVCRLY